MKNAQYLNEQGRFKAGNPGKPKGAISYRTKFLISLLECWGEKQQKILTGMLQKPNGNFLRALDRLIRACNSATDSHEEPSSEMPPFIVQIEKG